MTIDTQSGTVTYTGSGTRNFNIPFRVDDPSYFKVYVTNNAVSPPTVTEIPSTDYTITGSTLTYPKGTNLTALNSSKKITIQRILPLQQKTNFLEQTGYYLEDLEIASDYQMQALQQVNDTLSRCVKTPLGINTTPDSFLADIQTAVSQAEASATIAQNATQDMPAVPFKEVFGIGGTNPFTVLQSHNGNLAKASVGVGGLTVELPKMSTLAFPYLFAIKRSSGTQTLTVVPASGDTIEGASSLAIDINGQTVIFVADDDSLLGDWTTVPVGASVLSDNSITEGKIVDGAVTSSKLATDAVTNAKIASGAVTNVKLGNNSVTSGKIANGQLTVSHLGTAFKNIVDGILFSDVFSYNYDGSPYTLTSTQKGKLINIDTTGGDIEITLPSLSTISSPFPMIFRRTAGSGTVTFTADDDDTINASETTTFELSATVGNAVAFVGDITGATAGRWFTLILGSDATISDGSITASKIASNAVTTVKILDANVTTAKIADDAVTADKIATGAIALGNMQADSVDTLVIVDGSITADKMASASVTTTKIADDAVTTGKILDANVTTAKIADANVTTAKIADDAVTTGKILDANVTTAKIADDAVTTGKILDANVTTAKITDDAITTDKILDANVTTAKIADANVTTAKISDDAVTTAKIADNVVTTAKITDANVTTAKITDANVTTAKIADDAITTDKILDANVTTAKIADDAITTAKITDANVTTAKITDANVTTAKIADANVTTAKIADDAVTTAKIADDAITTAKILDANVTTAKIADDAVTTAKITDANVTTAKIADNAVTTAKITDANVTTAKIADDAVTTAKITDANVTTAKIADDAITTDKILDGEVTAVKMSGFFTEPRGRLTSLTGEPVPDTTVSTVTGYSGTSTTLYYTPYKGNTISLYDVANTKWRTMSFTEKSIAVPATTETNYDVFAEYTTATTFDLTLVAWTDQATRATALATQDGILVSSSDAGLLFLGTVGTFATSGTIDDTPTARGIANHYNKVERHFSVYETTSSWSYTTGAWRAVNGNTSNRVDFITPISGVIGNFIGSGYATGASGYVGIGRDATTPDIVSRAGNSTTNGVCVHNFHIPEGKTSLYLLEYGTSGSVFYGSSSFTSLPFKGLIGTAWI